MSDKHDTDIHDKPSGPRHDEIRRALAALPRSPMAIVAARQMAHELDQMAEMPLEGAPVDPLIDVINSLGHRAADMLREQEAEIARLRARGDADWREGRDAAKAVVAERRIGLRFNAAGLEGSRTYAGLVEIETAIAALSVPGRGT